MGNIFVLKITRWDSRTRWMVILKVPTAWFNWGHVPAAIWRHWGQLSAPAEMSREGFCSKQRFQSGYNDSATLLLSQFSSNCPDLERKPASDVGVQPPALSWRGCLLLSSSASSSFHIPPSCCRSRRWQIKPTSIWEQSWSEAWGSHWLCYTLVFLNRWCVIVGLWCLVAKSCSTLLWLHGQAPARLLCLWDFPGKNTRVGCHFLLQGIFLTQRLNLCLLHWQVGSLPLNHVGSPHNQINYIKNNVINTPSSSLSSYFTIIYPFGVIYIFCMHCIKTT